MEERQPAVAIPSWEPTQNRVLDAADDLLVRAGVHGVTIAALARRSGLSRPTIYRTWSDADDVVRAALLRRVGRLIHRLRAIAESRAALVDDVLAFIALFRADEVYGRLLDEEPEAFTRYTLQRVGSSQRLILDWLTAAIERAQAHGSVRTGVPGDIAVMLLLIAQSAVLSHGTVADLIDETAWERELRAALDGYLRP